MPLYNVYYTKDVSDSFSYSGEIEESQINYYKDYYIKSIINNDNIAIDAANTASMLSIFDENYTLENQYSICNSEYYKRFSTLKNNDIYSNEYYSYYTINDINELITLSGNTHNVKDLYGKYYVDNENNLRLLFNPDNILKTNIDKIFYSNYFIYYSNGIYYPIFVFIYTTLDDTNNVKLYYYNKFISNIIGNEIVDISLTSLYGNKWITLYDDFNNIDLYNNKYFIIQTLYNVGIFLNTEDGIKRYIPFSFTKKFFDILYNKMKTVHDGHFHFYSGSNNKNLVYTKLNDYGVYGQKEYSGGFKNGMPISIKNNSIEKILMNRKKIEQNTLSNISCLSNLFTLSSNANYFNDLIFDIAKSGETITIPIMLVNG